MKAQFLIIALLAPLFTHPSDANPRGLARAAAPAVLQTSSGPETVTTYADDCRTPKTAFLLGEVVCARAESFPLWPSQWRTRRFQWNIPDGLVAQEDDISSDPEYAYFKIPSSGSLARVGTWRVKTIDVDSGAYSTARFTVRHPLSVYTNLQLSKAGAAIVYPGTKVQHTVSIYNEGPDGAARITLTEDVPSNMVFLAVRQTAGPLASCKTPAYGEPGQIICTFSELGSEDTVSFNFVYGVNDTAREGTACAGTTNIQSYTEELDKTDNYANYEATVGVYVPPSDTTGDGGEPTP